MKAPNLMVCDIAMARRFLHALDPAATDFTFQTFGEGAAEDDGRLRQVLHGSFNGHAQRLEQLNKAGAGIFVMVNEGDGVVRPGRATARTNANVRRIRALFVDLDGSPLAPVLAVNPEPAITVESSPGRYHAYWRVHDCPLDQFKPLQLKLAQKFGGDPSVIDLARVMRLPGFVHQKGEPFLTRLLMPV